MDECQPLTVYRAGTEKSPLFTNDEGNLNLTVLNVNEGGSILDVLRIKAVVTCTCSYLLHIL